MKYLQCLCNFLGKETWCQFDTVFPVGPKLFQSLVTAERLWYH